MRRSAKPVITPRNINAWREYVKGELPRGVLRRRYQEIGGDEARSRNREYLIRRIPWMQ